MHTVVEQCAVGIDEIVGKMNKIGQAVSFLGDGVTVFAAYIEEHCTVPYTFAPAHLNKQRASTVAVLAMDYYRAGRVQSAAEHRPDYLRLSQAERERMEENIRTESLKK